MGLGGFVGFGGAWVGLSGFVLGVWWVWGEFGLGLGWVWAGFGWV